MHAARVYNSHRSLLQSIQEFIGGALFRGEAGVVIARRRHSAPLLKRLARNGHDVDALCASGRLAIHDVRTVLPAVMRGREPDRNAFFSLAGTMIEKALAAAPYLCLYGEAVDVLWQQENQKAADQLETWWNELIEEYQFTLLCGYYANALDERVQPGLHRICQAHTHLTPADNVEQFEASLEAAMQELIPHGDVDEMRRSLITQCPFPASMPDAQAMLFALNSVMPPLARDLRMFARRHQLQM